MIKTYEQLKVGDILTYKEDNARPSCVKVLGIFGDVLFITQRCNSVEDCNKTYEVYTRPRHYIEDKYSFPEVKRIPFKPELNEGYYWIDGRGVVDWKTNRDAIDKERIKHGNAFKTRDEAENYSKIINKILQG